MVLSLLIASCDKEETSTGKTTDEGTDKVVVTESSESSGSTGKVETGTGEGDEEEDGLISPDVPKYGGMLNLLGRDQGNFDTFLVFSYMAGSTYRTHDRLIGGDFYKGLAGTGETDWIYGAVGNLNVLTGYLCESWEFADSETTIYHIRKGVHFHDKPPTNGREMTADDVVFSFNRLWFECKQGDWVQYAPENKPISFTATDKYTVEVKVPAHNQGDLLTAMGEATAIYPQDAIEYFGDMSDWKNCIGTGPWMLDDYVAGSSMTFVRNPNYYMMDPMHPENRLPYFDGVKNLIMMDSSTQLAAMRTGKIDMMATVDADAKSTLTKYNESIVAQKRINSPICIYYRLDKDLPWNDIRVRRAMNMATNKQRIIDDYFEGEGYMLAVPYHKYASHSQFYIPLEEQSESVQELFEYNPEKAKELLTEAGYPDGFQTEVTCQNTIISGINMVDYLSVIMDDWAKVGVSVKITALDSSIYTGVKRGRTYEDAIMEPLTGYPYPYLFTAYRTEDMANLNVTEEPYLRECYNRCMKVLYKDTEAMQAVLKECGPYILEQALGIWMPANDVYTVWQPWLQNYRGEQFGAVLRSDEWQMWVWMDTELKKSLGY